MYSHGEAEQQQEMTGPGNSQSLHHIQNKPEKNNNNNNTDVNEVTHGPQLPYGT